MSDQQALPVMRVAYEFTVTGTPVPQGSMNVYNGRIVHQHDRELKAWRNAIHNACRGRMAPLEGAVTVEATFVLERKKSVRREHPFVKPDLDKLTRAVLDGLTGAAYHDDGQVTRLVTEKVYGTTPCVMLRVQGVKGGR